MDGVKTVDDLIKAKNLTPEESIQFKDMIEEFKERERIIDVYVNAAKSNLNELSCTLRILGEKASFLSKALQESLDEMEKVQLKLMPSDRFYRE